MGLEETSGSKACSVINSVSTSVFPLAPANITYYQTHVIKNAIALIMSISNE